MAVLLYQLKKMEKDMAVPVTHQGPFLLSSISNDSPYGPIIAALRTKNPGELTFDFVSDI